MVLGFVNHAEPYSRGRVRRTLWSGWRVEGGGCMCRCGMYENCFPVSFSCSLSHACIFCEHVRFARSEPWVVRFAVTGVSRTPQAQRRPTEISRSMSEFRLIVFSP